MATNSPAVSTNALAVASSAITEATGALAVASNALAQARPPVMLLEASRDYHLGDNIRVQLSGEFGVAVTKALAGDRGTTLTNLKLYLDGVMMEGISAADFAPTNPGALVELQFTIKRESKIAKSRESWDRLLDRINYQNNSLAVAVASRAFIGFRWSYGRVSHEVLSLARNHDPDRARFD